MTHPVRLRLSRAKGFNLQEHSRSVNGLPAVNCARPGKWGNPFVIGMTEHCGVKFSGGPLTRDQAVDLHQDYIGSRLRDFPDTLNELRGKNLACVCGPRERCHCDVLLELANRPICEAIR